MTYKYKTIKACLELAKKYRNPQGKFFFISKGCSLCVVYGATQRLPKCAGCFQKGKSWYCGGYDMKSYRKALEYLESINGAFNTRYPNDKKTSITFIHRAEFFERMAVELEKFLAKQFTPAGWKYFEISRNQ